MHQGPSPTPRSFEFYALRFSFLVDEAIRFPAGKQGNVLRGAFGTILKRIACVPACTDVRTCEFQTSCTYARIFEPRLRGGPSGLADLPRPFVFRARHLDGCDIGPGHGFHFDLHVFDLHQPVLDSFVHTFAEMARAGIGPRRARARLVRVHSLDQGACPLARISDGPPPLVRVPLDPPPGDVTRIRVEFLTPTELKSEHRIVEYPEFKVLFGRARDRLSTLSAAYGHGPLAIDFQRLGEQAAEVRLTRSELRTIQSDRRSSRTGMIHSIGGFVGWAEYDGTLAPLVPYLQAARWTGIGRQTVWGKGEIEVHILS